MQTHQLATQRFANTVILPLASLFRVCGSCFYASWPSSNSFSTQLDPSSISIFHDSAGPLIAFNRGGTLYLNL